MYVYCEPSERTMDGGEKKEKPLGAQIHIQRIYRFVKKKKSYLSEDPTEAVYTTDRHVYVHKHTHTSYGNARASGVHGRMVKRYTHAHTHIHTQSISLMRDIPPWPPLARLDIPSSR